MSTAFRCRWWLAAYAAFVLLLSGCDGQSKKTTPETTAGPPVEIGKTIRLVPGMANALDRVAPWSAGASVAWNRHNHIRWSNETNDQQTIKFVQADWIFMEPWADVVVEPHSRTQWFTVTENATVGVEHKYGVAPLLTGPPDEPGITAEP